MQSGQAEAPIRIYGMVIYTLEEKGVGLRSFTCPHPEEEALLCRENSAEKTNDFVNLAALFIMNCNQNKAFQTFY